MLVLTRKEKQEIRIGDNVKITVVKVQGNSIRIGIEAPKGVRILRGELAEWHDLSFEEVGFIEGEPALAGAHDDRAINNEFMRELAMAAGGEAGLDLMVITS